MEIKTLNVSIDYASFQILDFVYTGEANVNKKEIESFLQVANDLQIKGLIEKNTLRKTSIKEGELISPQD